MEGAKLIITVHVVEQYMDFILASENIDEGRKSNLAITNSFVSPGMKFSVHFKRTVGILMNMQDA